MLCNLGAGWCGSGMVGDSRADGWEEGTLRGWIWGLKFEI